MQTWMRQHRGPFKGGIKAGFSGFGFLLQGIDFFHEIAVSETKSEKKLARFVLQTILDGNHS